jgi:hypothetical protein
VNSNSTEKNDIRKFGLFAFLFFMFLCGLGLWSGKAVPIYLFGFLSITGLGLLLLPELLRPVYTGWLRITDFIAKIVTLSGLTLAYYLVITPSAVLKRIFGGAPLPVKPDKKAASYWVARDEPVQPRERFLKRY